MNYVDLKNALCNDKNYVYVLRRCDIIVYFNVNLKLLTKLIKSAFVGE